MKIKIENKITPFLWFDHQAESAVEFYCAIFANARITSVSKAGEKVMSVNFTLNGQDFIALNGGPHFRFTEAISLFVHCETQEEVDYYWSKLTDGGEESRCGWLKDKYGLWWQIVPNELGKLIGDKDPAKAERAVKAMLGMNKIELQKLRDAHAGNQIM